MCLRIKIVTLGTKAIFYSVCRYHHLFLSVIFSLRCSKRGCYYYITSQAGQDRGNKTSPVTTTNSNELQINTNLLESNKTKVLFTWKHIQALQQYSHSKVNFNYTYISLQTEKALCGGEHTTSTPRSPLQILSGLRKLIIDNKCKKKKKRERGKNSTSISIQQQRKATLALWACLARGQASLFVTIVPKLTMAMLTF